MAWLFLWTMIKQRHFINWLPALILMGVILSWSRNPVT